MLPLTAAQEELWLAYCRDRTSPALSTADAIEIPGPVKPDLLRRAIQLMYDETEALRLAFGEADGVPWQEVRPPRPLTIPVIDLRAAASRQSAFQQAHEWMADELARPARLDRGAEPVANELADPIFGAALFELPGGDVLWYQRAHHIAVDGYAVSLITQRVAELYRDISNGRPVAARPGGLTDVIAEETAYRSAPERLRASRDYWMALLAPAATGGLADRVAPPAPRALRTGSEVSSQRFAVWQAAAAQSAVSWPDLLFAAAAVYLQRMTGDPAPVVGVAMMNRLGSRAATVPASVMNITALPVEVGETDRIGDVAARFGQHRRAQREHCRYRYEQVRRDLRRHHPDRRLFGILVNVLGFTAPLSFGAAQARAHTLSTGPVDDLNLTVVPHEGGLRVELDGNPGVFSSAELDAHLSRLLHVIDAVAREPAEPLAGVEAVTAEERDMVLRDWNRTAHRIPEVSLAELLVRQARRTPEAPAVRSGAEVLSYDELDARSSVFATALRQYGAGPGSVVAVALPRSAELVVALVAVLKAGAAYLPIDPEYPAERIRFLLDDATPVCVVAGHDLPGNPGLPVASVPRSGCVESDTLCPPKLDDAAYVIYTSGSTGQPKGVPVSHRAIVNRLLWMADRYGIGAQDRILQKTPDTFDVSVWEFFLPLMTGAVLVVAKPDGHRDPVYLGDLIRSEAITTAHFVPSMLHAFLAEPTTAGCADVLRRVICSGEALSPEAVRRFHDRLPGVELHNLYGPTEAAVDVTAWACSPADVEVPIGRPVWNTRVYVLDAAGRLVPPGVPGELYLAGVQLAHGYLNREELTRERFVPDPFVPGEQMYRTGDLGCWRPDGALLYLGRSDGQVKLRGMRIELGEIEQALLRQPDVANAVVALRADREQDQRLVGYVLPAAGSTPDLGALHAALAAELPAQLVPTTLMTIDAVPVTANGKLDRTALPPPDLQHAAPAPQQVAATPRAELIVRLFAELLGTPRVDVDGNFFDLGGHSLLAVELARRLSAAVGEQVNVGAVFAAPTPRRLAAELGAGEASTALAPVLTLRAGRGVPLWCVHPAGGLGWCYSTLAAALPARTPVHVLQAPHLTGQQPEGPSHRMTDVVASYLDAMLAVQPGGPFQLLGWSVGGVIAHALGIALQERGFEVATVALLDAYPADQWRDLALPSERDALRALLHIGGIDPETVRRLDRDEVIGVLREAGSALSTLPSKVLDAMLDLVMASTRLMRTHQHGTFDGDLLFYGATAPRPETWLDRTGWLPYLTGALVPVDLPCTHPGMVSPPMSRRIADHLTDRLR